MEKINPVYTVQNECQDCYKCVRHCLVKAIEVRNGSAAVIPELCVACGECVRVCPAHAKKIRSDLASARQLLLNARTPVYASIAPSFTGYFPGVSIGQIAAALKKLGFAGTGETALGAQLTSAAVGEFLKTAPPGVYLSSACPAAVDFVTRRHPEWAGAITPVASPIIAYTRLIHEQFGAESPVIFFGPCAAKKNEADRAPRDLALALTFPVLEEWLEAAGIDLSQLAEEPLVPTAAEEGRCYSFAGGMLDTIRRTGDGVRYLAVAGLGELDSLLCSTSPAKLDPAGGKLLIEMLACSGGCVHGPAMPPEGAGIETILRTMSASPDRVSVGRELPVSAHDQFPARPEKAPTITETKITEALATVGKFTLADELNCGGCGYNSCRDFAHGLVLGKAEPSMCVSYLRKISEKTSTALIKFIPVGVVLVDADLAIIECNRNFAEICGEGPLAQFELSGNLNGELLPTLVEYCDLFESVLPHGGELERFNQSYGGKILNICVFSISPGRTAGAVIQDVTRSEIQREEIAAKAREVIRKNVITVQKIAHDLGEHIADTEVLLNEVAGAYSKTGAKK